MQFFSILNCNIIHTLFSLDVVGESSCLAVLSTSVLLFLVGGAPVPLFVCNLIVKNYL